MVYYIPLQKFLRAEKRHENMYTAYTPYSTKLIDARRFICMMAVRLNSCQEKKEEIWLSPMTKAPTPTEMSKGQSDNTNNATKKFD